MPDAADALDPQVAIVGSGMVGGALACALALQGFRVTVIEAQAPQSQWPAAEVDLRVSALSRASQRILENLGVWSRMEELRVSAYREMHVWDAQGSGSIHFSAADLGEPDLGHIVENRVTQLALWERLRGLENVEIICPETLQGLELGRAHPVLSLRGGRRVEAELVVGADGGRSAVRALAGIQTRGWLYDQHALVANVRPARSHGETAWQRFMHRGPLAMLPLNDGRCSIVWSTSPQHAQELLALDDERFCRALREASEGILGEIEGTGPRATFPLALRHAESYVRSGLALVGDAAHSVHPLAGQGVNLGFLDAATLADTLLAARAARRKLGAVATLRRYERSRKGDNLAMLALMDGFKRLFSNDLLGLRLLRNLGLNLADASGPVKRELMRRAMGCAGELPSLATPTAAWDSADGWAEPSAPGGAI